MTGAELASAVSNAGGIGTIGAIGMSPEGLRAEIRKLVTMLDPGDSIAGTLPFGVDLLLPQVGGNARKTNKDYTGGQLEAVSAVQPRLSSWLAAWQPAGQRSSRRRLMPSIACGSSST